MHNLLDEMSFKFLDTYSKNNKIEGADDVPDGMIEIGQVNS